MRQLPWRKNWKETKFDHEKTRFPLVGGKHGDVKCKECHLDMGYKNAPLECNACHKKIDQEKGHKGRYGTKCESCHTDKGWKKLRFDHDTDTRYVLRGKHRPAKCDSCHLPEKGAIYQVKLPNKCVACHKKDDKEKGHQGGLGEKCENCHNEKSWKSLSFEHDIDTKYPLRDKHKSAKCEACHKGEVPGKSFKFNLKLEKECVACHKKNDQEKGHKGRYGNKCEDCHSEKEWKTSIFDHDRDTKYRLRDKHLQPKCDDCHLPAKGPIYQKKLETQCIACHKKDDKHNGQLVSKCESCHNENHWKDAPFDHAKARFQLTGSHIKTECKKCHLTPAFRDVSSVCNGCHEKEVCTKEDSVRSVRIAITPVAGNRGILTMIAPSSSWMAGIRKRSALTATAGRRKQNSIPLKPAEVATPKMICTIGASVRNANVAILLMIGVNLRGGSNHIYVSASGLQPLILGTTPFINSITPFIQADGNCLSGLGVASPQPVI